jgi:hypothetical protein
MAVAGTPSSSVSRRIFLSATKVPAGAQRQCDNLNEPIENTHRWCGLPLCKRRHRCLCVRNGKRSTRKKKKRQKKKKKHFFLWPLKNARFGSNACGAAARGPMQAKMNDHIPSPTFSSFLYFCENANACADCGSVNEKHEKKKKKKLRNVKSLKMHIETMQFKQNKETNQDTNNRTKTLQRKRTYHRPNSLRNKDTK